MEIKGYKAFNHDLTNRYGKKFNEGVTYYINAPIKYGNNGNGYHFCKRLEDTLRYFNPNDIAIAEVTGLGNIHESFDEYYEYYDLYVTDTIRIDKVLEREEIINRFLHQPEYRVRRFLENYILNSDEIQLFKYMYKDNEDVLNTIAYYQEKDKKIFEKSLNKRKRL